MKRRTKNPDSKPLGRPRRHRQDAVTCVVKLPPDLVRWIDQRYPTRQDGIAAIVAAHVANVANDNTPVIHSIPELTPMAQYS